jgi:carbon-monoxide dehydrogenase large subunit
LSITHEPPRSRFVGSRLLRVEDDPFLHGRAQYVDDIELPRMLHATFVRSPMPHARITGMDVAAARAVPGVAAVLTGEELRTMTHPLVAVMDRPESVPVSRDLLAYDVVRFVGEPVAAVVAESRAAAEDAAELVIVDYEPLEPIVDGEAALADGAPLLHADVPNNNAGHIEFDSGDVDELFARAHRVFSKRFFAARHAAAPLECHAAIADWNAFTSELTLWASLQSPHLARVAIAHHLGCPESRVRVVAPAVGGGFGSKNIVSVEEYVLIFLSRIVGRPVKWIADRQEELAAGPHAKELISYIDIAVDEDGRFTAFRGRYIGNGGAYSLPFATAMLDPLHAATLLPSIYDIKGCAYTTDAALTNKSWSAPYRGVGMTSGHTARELLIDEIARELDVDPVALRLANCIPSTPYTSAVGMHYDGGSYAQSIERARELIDYEGFRAQQARDREAGRYRGVGFSPFVEPTGFGSDIARACGLAGTFFDTVSVTVEPDGSVVVSTGLHSHGQGHETTFAQVTADALGVRPSDVRVLFGDTARDVFGSGTYASRSAVVGGGAAMRAATDVRTKLVRVFAHALEVAPDDVELANGVAWVTGSPERSMTVPEIAARAYWGAHDRPDDGVDPALTATRHYDPPETYSNGVVVAIVEVDVETGMVDVTRCVAVEDCGVMINPMIVDGQVAGAIAQGIGGALYEECFYDDDGQPRFTTLMDYLYPSTTEVPTIEITHLETPSPVTEGGIKGVGEGGTIAAPAAVVNAIYDALQPLGVTLDRTPVTPHYLLERLDAAHTARGRAG